MSTVGIGERLRSAREARGLSLDDAAAATRIRRRYLEALEDEAFDRVPAPAYGRAFLVSYASYLGLPRDETAVMAAGLAAAPAGQRGAPGGVLIQPVTRRPRARRVAAGVALVVAAGLAVVAYTLYGQVRRFVLTSAAGLPGLHAVQFASAPHVVGQRGRPAAGGSNGAGSAAAGPAATGSPAGAPPAGASAASGSASAAGPTTAGAGAVPGQALDVTAASGPATGPPPGPAAGQPSGQAAGASSAPAAGSPGIESGAASGAALPDGTPPGAPPAGAAPRASGEPSASSAQGASAEATTSQYSGAGTASASPSQAPSTGAAPPSPATSAVTSGEASESQAAAAAPAVPGAHPSAGAASPTSPRPATTAVKAPAAPAAAAGKAPAKPTVTAVRLVAVAAARSWVRVLADGRTVFVGFLNAGDRRTWQAGHSLSLRIGNAGAVRLTVNGRALGVAGRPGEVVDETFNAGPP